jgi:hypothetical protein
VTRVALTDDSGCWLETEAAVAFEENTRWDGNNHVSLATGTQWDHQVLYRTMSNNWVLHSWSQWQGSAESYEQISDEDAVAWLIKNEHFDKLDRLEGDIREAVEAAIEAREI